MGAVRSAVKTPSATVDITGLYLSEIGAEGLLNADEEVSLARQIAAGCKRSRERMIAANLRLVVHIARGYLHRGLPLLDLVEEGNLGLIHAVDKFDPERGCRFSTYGSWWIRQAIERGLINQGRTVRLPVHVVRKVSKCVRKANEMCQADEAQPSSRQLARAMDQSADEVDQLLAYARARPVSHGTSNGTSNGTSDQAGDDPLDFVADEDAAHPDHLYASGATHRLLIQWLSQLDQLQQTVVRNRYGLEGTGPRTLREVAESLGISGERVRQIQLSALAHLRRISHEQGIDDLPFLD